MPDYLNRLSSKLPKAGTSIFTVMSKLAQDHRAINLSQGFPDFAVSDRLIELVHHYMRAGMNQYAPMQGLLALRETIAGKTASLNGADYHPETEINITAGATQAIFTAIAATVREEEEVIIFTPAYDCYAPAVELCGGKPVYIQLNAPDYRIDWDEVKKRVHRKTRMIIINSPHNPSGTIMTAKDMEELEKLTANTDIIILSDEVYEHIIFDGQPHESAARYPGLAERAFVISSFGKTFHATGWKTGYVLAPKELMAEFRKVHQFMVFSCNTPVQYALTDFLENKDHYLHLGAFYQEKRDRFLQLIDGSRFNAIPSGGTYFQLLDYSNITDERDTDFAIRLTKENGIASIPVSVFYHSETDHKVLRFCFAKGDDTLEKAAAVIRRI